VSATEINKKHKERDLALLRKAKRREREILKTEGSLQRK